jgi:hypothetical protein
VCTYTQGGWGTECKGNNPGCVRDANFANDFPSGLFIGGDAAGALWTTSQAIEQFLPAGGKPAALVGQSKDPTSTAAGVLAGQQVAAKLNVGILDAPTRYVFVGCVARELIGVSVGDVIAMADEAMSSGSPPSGLSFSDLSDALATFNENYDECDDEGCLAPSLRQAPQLTPGRKPVGTMRRPSLPTR